MASVLPIQTYEYKLNEIEIVDGQLIVCVDTGSLYKDSSNKRIKIASEFETVDSLPETPQKNKLYFINETNELWVYDGEWVKINNSLFVKSDPEGGISLSLGDQKLDAGIKIKGKGATSITTDGETVSISTDPNGAINVISNLEIDKLLSM